MTYKILIVDDSKLARMAMARGLNACCPDWPRIEAASAADAVSAAEREAPDIALVDFNMPGGDGLSLVSALSKAHPRMRIALISANHQQQIIDRTNELGATFLGKPLGDEELGKFVQAAARALENSKK